MTTLAELQRAFVAALLEGDERGVAPQLRADALPRLAIHRGNLRANQRDALAATYPVVRRLVGDAFFGALAHRYAARWPSRSGDLHAFGAALAGFLAADPRARGLPYLPDVARLEWACHESLHAADAPPIDALALARVEPRRQGAVRLRLDPSVRAVESAHPVVSIWEANQPDRDGTPERTSGAERALVGRGLEGVRVRRLDEEEWRLVRSIAAGASLEEAAEVLGPAAQGALAPVLARLARDGAIAGFEVPGGCP